MSKIDGVCIYCMGEAHPWCRSNSNFLECEECGLVYRNPMPTDSLLQDIYKEYYANENIVGNNTCMLSSASSTKNHANYILKLTKPGVRVLDFGAGTGELASILQSAGVSVEGLEYSIEAIEEAKNRHGFHFYSSLEDVLANRKAYYDIIVGIEVIEHLKEPGSVLQDLCSLLKPGGAIYLTTPNRNGLQARLKRCQWREAEKQFHLVLFNYWSLKNILQKCGFESVRYLRFSPLTDDALFSVIKHRMMQVLGLYGGLRVIAYRSKNV